MQAVYEVASYITVNISSPNTQNLRALQGEDMLRSLLGSLHLAREALSDKHGVSKPLFLKIAPDLNQNDIKLIADLLLEFKIDAIIATNTTISRDAVQGLQFGEELGGLSGAPVRNISTEVVQSLHQHLGFHVRKTQCPSLRRRSRWRRPWRHGNRTARYSKDIS
jgi:dihydroorotate dehydrogenase